MISSIDQLLESGYDAATICRLVKERSRGMKTVEAATTQGGLDADVLAVIMRHLVLLVTPSLHFHMPVNIFHSWSECLNTSKTPHHYKTQSSNHNPNTVSHQSAFDLGLTSQACHVWHATVVADEARWAELFASDWHLVWRHENGGSTGQLVAFSQREAPIRGIQAKLSPISWHQAYGVAARSTCVSSSGRQEDAGEVGMIDEEEEDGIAIGGEEPLGDPWGGQSLSTLSTSNALFLPHIQADFLLS